MDAESITTLAIAGAALVQPWLIGGYRRWVAPGTVEIYPSGKIEVSYGVYGPAIVLTGALRAIHRMKFVSNIRLTIVREADSSTHVFDWAAFRGLEISNPHYEIPSAFSVDPALEKPYTIAFTDGKTKNEIERVLTPVIEAWTNVVVARRPDTDEERTQVYGEFSQGEARICSRRARAHQLLDGWTLPAADDRFDLAARSGVRGRMALRAHGRARRPSSTELAEDPPGRLCDPTTYVAGVQRHGRLRGPGLTRLPCALGRSGWQPRSPARPRPHRRGGSSSSNTSSDAARAASRGMDMVRRASIPPESSTARSDQ